MEFVQVKSGDSLSIIARDVLGDIDRWPEIARLNNLTAPYTIVPGMQLMMPETGAIDARRYPVRTEPDRPTLEAGIGMTPQAWVYLIAGVVVFLLTTKDGNQ